MSQYGSWSVKGVDDRARAIAKEKARLKGVTLGDYINNLLLEGHSEAGPRDAPQYAEPARSSLFSEPPRHTPLDNLAQRIEAVEARSTLAITGIDQSVLGLLARLESSENSTSAMTAEVERMIDELRETHEMLHAKVGALEADDSGHKSLEAMKALEDALGKLASHVYEESRMAQDESGAMKGRVEAGFSELADRVEGIEVKVESTLSTAASRVEKAVEQAELRAEGTARLLSERLSNMEASIATKRSKADTADARLNVMEGDVSSAITSMESTLERVQGRLARAENTTDAALKALEGTFANLDQRIDAVAERANPERAEQLRAELEQRFDALAEDLRASVDQTRRHLADEIERAAAGQNPEWMGALESRVNTLEASDVTTRFDAVNDMISDLSENLGQRITDSDDRNASAIEQVGKQISGITDLVDDRVLESEQRNAQAIEQIGEHLSGVNDRFADRILDSERRSAKAIEQVGEQVATAIKHIQVRQEKSQQTLAETVADSEQRQDARLSDALSNISDRLSDMQTQTVSAMSPVQRAIVSLADRLEALEDFNAPPLAEPESAPLPDLSEMAMDSAPIESLAPEEPEPSSEPEMIDDYHRLDEAADGPDASLESSFEVQIEALDSLDDEPDASEAPEAEANFIAGLPDFDEDAREIHPDLIAAAETWDTPEPEADHGSDPTIETASPAELEEDFLSQVAQEPMPEAETVFESDPLSELGNWDESQQEARDSDIFSMDEELPEEQALLEAGLDPLFAVADALAEPALPDEAEQTIPDLTEFLPELEDEALAHNMSDIAVEDEAPEPLESPENDDPVDYLNRARSAAIAAATESKAESRARRSIATTTVKPSSNRKFPIIAAASALAITAAGAGGWVALRGKVPFSNADAPTIATNSTLAAAAVTPTEADPGEIAAGAPDEGAIAAPIVNDAAPDALEDTLFEAAENVPAPPPVALDLPRIPEAQTLAGEASNGNPVAQFQLGETRLEAQNFARGAELISAAAQQGLPAAQYRLAKLHERGIGVPRDLTEARAWTERAANGGNIKAMHDLAVFFADGEGGPQSYAGAAEWFRKAADHGVVDSQYNLAVLYENGLGISPSQTEALYWYEIAAANGDASAPGNVAALRDALPLERAQDAQRRASAWSITASNRAANGNFGRQSWQRSSRAQVSAVQTVLNGLGYPAGPADGLAGAGTRTAIRAFQADNGLATTGTVDAELIKTLNTRTQGFAG